MKLKALDRMLSKTFLSNLKLCAKYHIGNWPGNIVFAVRLSDSTLLDLLDKVSWFHRQRKHRSAEW